MTKYNDTGWMLYGHDYDDDGLQTYFEDPIIKCRFWDNKKGHAFYDVILLSDLVNHTIQELEVD
jgi:hypothetical protein